MSAKTIDMLQRHRNCARRLLPRAVFALATFAGASDIVFAHHSFASVYDRESPVALTGTVTKVEWMNPHMWFYIDVENANGVSEQWALELGSPNSLIRRGWSRDSLKVGQAVKINGYRARNGSLTAAVSAVTLSSGEPLSGGQPDVE